MKQYLSVDAETDEEEAHLAYKIHVDLIRWHMRAEINQWIIVFKKLEGHVSECIKAYSTMISSQQEYVCTQTL